MVEIVSAATMPTANQDLQHHTAPSEVYNHLRGPYALARSILHWEMVFAIWTHEM